MKVLNCITSMKNGHLMQCAVGLVIRRSEEWFTGAHSSLGGGRAPPRCRLRIVHSGRPVLGQRGEGGRLDGWRKCEWDNFHNHKGLDNALNLVLGRGAGQKGTSTNTSFLDYHSLLHWGWVLAAFEALLHALFKIFGLGGNGCSVPCLFYSVFRDSFSL